MEPLGLAILSKDELESIKGGGHWVYDKDTDKWYWVDNVRLG